MKKTSIFLLASLAFAQSVSAQSENNLYFTEAALQPGEMTNVELCMKNSEAKFTCVAAEILLPAGISVVCDADGQPVATLYRNRTSGHQLLANVFEDGRIRLLVSAMDGSLLTGEEGPLLSFRVKADAQLMPGVYAMETAGESLLVNRTAEPFYSTGVEGSILVLDDATELAPVQSGDNDTPVYNLAGQRVQRPGRGVFIQGTRKVYLK